MDGRGADSAEYKDFVTLLKMLSMRISRLYFGTLIWILTSGTFLLAQDISWESKVDSDLLIELQSGESYEFIIKMKSEADLQGINKSWKKDDKASHVYLALSQKATQSQQDVLALLEDHNAPVHSLFIVNVIKSYGDIELVELLAKRKDVENIQPNPSIPYHGTVRTAEVSRNTEWGIQMINADSVWALGYSGQGVTIGGQDTGYEWEHPALKNKYRGYDAASDVADHNYNWHDAIHEISPLHNDSIVDASNNPCGLDSDFPCDDNNHGTHTMGTMVGSDGDNEIGVAPEAQWCACRNMERGWGTPFTYLECFEWFLAPTDLNGENPDPWKAPHVIANSWGCPEIEGCNPMNFEILNEAVKNLVEAGTVVVVSAGNSGSDCSSVNTPSAIFEKSFTIGATNAMDTIAGFSSRGPVIVDESGRLKPNVVAPGVGIRSTIRNGEYASFSGTSMAGPHVAGVVALMISARPDLSGEVELIEYVLESTAIPLITTQECAGIPGETIPNHTYGYGRIDALAAVEMALTLFIESTDEEKYDLQVSIFPNPTKGMISLDTKEIQGEYTFTLFSIDGAKLLSRDYQSFGGSQQIDMQAYAAGVYIAKIKAKQGEQTVKIVKQ